ncbi:MAG: hypothetical protein ABI651_16420 [Verrucomicrobiota bacterium]
MSRRLQEILPGLAFKTASLDQRDFVLPDANLNLFFGTTVSLIQTLAPDQQEFPSTAVRFLQTVTDVLEVSQLSEFRFRYVLGKPCSSDEEAQKLMWPLVPEESKAKMSSLAEPPQWQAIQGEFLLSNLACQSRIAILYLIPHEKLAPDEAKSGRQLPHITFQLDVRGLAPVDVAKFDAEAFIKNVRDNHTHEILSKLAPHLT